ncbi:MAG TPA: hypothetical protein VIG74_00460 [Alphaproteobacteria bacterium]
MTDEPFLPPARLRFMDQDQRLSDPPRTKKEARRQKGPVPVTAIFLALAFIVVLALFFGPAFFLQANGG